MKQRNTLVTQLGRTGSKWQYKLLQLAGIPTFHEPIGGWAEGEFDKELPWDKFIITRFSCTTSNFPNRAFAKPFPGNAEDYIRSSSYVEIGLSTLPFISNTPCDWKVIGIVRHPQTWIASAMINNFYQASGTKMSWSPKPPTYMTHFNHYESLHDYAKIWAFFTERILKRADRIYRFEDITKKPTFFLQEFGCFKDVGTVDYNEIRSDDMLKKQARLKFIDEPTNYWNVVSNLAEKLDYKMLDLKK